MGPKKIARHWDMAPDLKAALDEYSMVKQNYGKLCNALQAKDCPPRLPSLRKHQDVPFLIARVLLLNARMEHLRRLLNRQQALVHSCHASVSIGDTDPGNMPPHLRVLLLPPVRKDEEDVPCCPHWMDADDLHPHGRPESLRVLKGRSRRWASISANSQWRAQ
jgi:hypothetical protein